MNKNTSNNYDTKTQTSEHLLKQLSFEAKKLHRLCFSDKKSSVLPVLRRILQQNVLTNLSLVELFTKRNMIQRKHLFQLLALESGFSSWAQLKQNLTQNANTQINHFGIELKQCGHLNLWFSNLDSATEFQAEHGGQTIQVGEQAVVIQERPQSS